MLSLALVLAAALAVGLIFFKGNEDTLTRYAQEEMERSLDRDTMEIQATVESLRNDVFFLSRTPPIQGIVRARMGGGVDPVESSSGERWRKRLETIFEEFLRANPAYLRIAYIGISDHGRELVRVHREDGRVRSARKGELQARDGESLYLETVKLERGKVHLSAIALNREQGKMDESGVPALQVSVPVFDSFGKIFGVVAIDMNFQPALDKFRMDGYLNYMANEAGDLLLHPDPGKAFGIDRERTFTLQEEYPGLSPLLSGKAGDRIFALSEVQGRPLAVAAVKFPLGDALPGRHLILARVADREQSVRSLIGLRNQSLAVTGILLIFAGGLAVYLTRRAARPIQTMIAATRDIAEGRRVDPLPEDAGGDIGVLARAVNDMKRSLEERTQAIHRERQNLYDMLDSLPFAFHLQARDYTVPFANRMFRGRFGEPGKRMCFDLMHNRPMPCEVCSTFKVFDDRNTRVSVWKAIDGNTYQTVVTPFQDIDGSTLVMEMAVDVSDLKRAEEALREARDQLEERVRQRTFDLQAAHERLRVSSEELKRSNRELEQFAGIASHDLKEPLRKIKLFVSMFQDEAQTLSDKARHNIDRVLGAVERMQGMIEALLDYSRVTTQKRGFSKTDLNHLLKEVLCDLEARIQDRGGMVQVGELPVLPADKVQMYQLFQNLIGNALKFSREEEVPKVQVLSRKMGSNGYEIRVRDNGIGVDPAYVKNLFQPFTRLHPKNKFDGHGVGLAICKKIVERHQGRIDVESQPGQGTDFIITLPAEPFEASS